MIVFIHNDSVRETERTLRVLIRELTEVKRGNLASPTGGHKIETHDGNDSNIKYKILS